MNIMKYIAYTAAVLFIVLGTVILSGLFFKINFPSEFKITVGVVFILYGIYRFVTTYFKKDRTIE